MTGARVAIKRPEASDAEWYLDAVRRSVDFISPWNPVSTERVAFAQILDRDASPSNAIFLVVDIADGGCAGKIAINNIVRGLFHSASIGYDAFVPYAGTGRMYEAMRLVIDRCFTPEHIGGLGLHRLEINVQPANERSISLARRLGFRYEGFSPRYLYINGAWRDHDRYALTSEEWPTPSSS